MILLARTSDKLLEDIISGFHLVTQHGIEVNHLPTIRASFFRFCRIRVGDILGDHLHANPLRMKCRRCFVIRELNSFLTQLAHATCDRGFNLVQRTPQYLQGKGMRHCVSLKT